MPDLSTEEKRHKPSSTPTSVCKPDQGQQVCCERITTASDLQAKLLLGLLGIKLPPEATVGIDCLDVKFGLPW